VSAPLPPDGGPIIVREHQSPRRHSAERESRFAAIAGGRPPPRPSPIAQTGPRRGAAGLKSRAIKPDRLPGSHLDHGERVLPHSRFTSTCFSTNKTTRPYSRTEAICQAAAADGLPSTKLPPAMAAFLFGSGPGAKGLRFPDNTPGAQQSLCCERPLQRPWCKRDALGPVVPRIA